MYHKSSTKLIIFEFISTGFKQNNYIQNFILGGENSFYFFYFIYNFLNPYVGCSSTHVCIKK